jgi:hypothetical protein
VQRAPAGRRDAPSRATVARALGGVATEYGLLATAARDGSKARYASRRSALTREQRALAASVLELGRLGYDVQ